MQVNVFAHIPNSRILSLSSMLKFIIQFSSAPSGIPFEKYTEAYI